LNQLDEVFSVTGQVRFDGACFTGRKEGMADHQNVWTSIVCEQALWSGKERRKEKSEENNGRE